MNRRKGEASREFLVSVGLQLLKSPKCSVHFLRDESLEIHFAFLGEKVMLYHLG